MAADPSVPEDAIKILNDATSEVQANRAGHQVLQMSLDTLKLVVGQWRAMQAPTTMNDPEDPSKLLTEGGKKH